MDNQELETRLMNIEITLANQEKIIDDLNQVIIDQIKVVDRLQKQQRYMVENMNVDVVKPQSEEAPPPHY